MTSALPKAASLQQGFSAQRLAGSFEPRRREPRINQVRSAEYTPFPRVSSDQQPRLGFTRDVSSLGMCLGVDSPEPVGSLLRVEVRHIDGEPMGATVARVAWCSPAHGDRYWLGLDLLCEVDAQRVVVQAVGSGR